MGSVLAHPSNRQPGHVPWLGYAATRHRAGKRMFRRAYPLAANGGNRVEAGHRR